MKLKKIFYGITALGLFLGLASCDNNEEPADSNEKETNGDTQDANNDKPKDGNVKIYLAGDSTVKTYNDNQYIGGWGQFIDRYLPSDVTVVNCAEGGRSTRSFINEGRLFNLPNDNPSFKQNGGKAIEETIDGDDYLFIQFGHNDDDTKAASTLIDRMVPLGTPVNNVYPVTEGTKTNITKEGKVISDSSISASVKTAMSSYSSNLTQFKTTAASYGDSYYEYSSGGTYKWFLKQYIDLAREKGATPVLVTPVARLSFNGNTIKSGPGLHGENFAYVEAMKQLASEEDVMLIDLFTDSKNMLEAAGPSYAHSVMALKNNALTGVWPGSFDEIYDDNAHENTHYNKYGAFIEAAFIAEELKAKQISGANGKETIKFNVNENPTSFINPSNNTPKSVSASIEAMITGVNVTDSNRTYPEVAPVISAIDALTDVANIDASNYKTVLTAVSEVEAAYKKLNVDDKSLVTNISKFNAVKTKALQVEEENRPVAQYEYTLDCKTGTLPSATGTPFKADNTENKLSASTAGIKLGGNGTATSKHLAVTMSGTGHVVIEMVASISVSDTTKSATLEVSDKTTPVSYNITTSNPTKYTFEFELDGTTTYYMYRSTGSTGITIESIKASLY